MSVNVKQCVQMPFGLSFRVSGALTGLDRTAASQ